MKPFAALINDSNQAGISFLFTELETAMTFLRVAETTRNQDSAARNHDNARAAYESAIHYQGRVRFGEDEKKTFENKLAELKRVLLAAGVAV